MRTIKFKGKRRDNGEWVSGDLAHSLNGNLNILVLIRKMVLSVFPGRILSTPILSASSPE